MLNGGDMVVSLYSIPDIEITNNIKIKSAFVGDKEIILKFVEKYF